VIIRDTRNRTYTQKPVQFGALRYGMRGVYAYHEAKRAETMQSQHTGKMTAAGFNANAVELDAIKRCAAKNRESQASWCRRTLMKAAAEELGVPYATLDRFSPAYGSGPRALPAMPVAPSPARVAAAERLQAAQAEADRIQAAADAKKAAAAKLEAALAELDALAGGDEPTAVKPRRRR
jgi:hypothetical protein